MKRKLIRLLRATWTMTWITAAASVITLLFVGTWFLIAQSVHVKFGCPVELSVVIGFVSVLMPIFIGIIYLVDSKD